MPDRDADEFSTPNEARGVVATRVVRASITWIVA
jgi:hypothetical protein